MKNAVRNLAYNLWEQAGRPEGRDQEFWLDAERLLAKPSRETKGMLAPRGTKPEIPDPDTTEAAAPTKDGESAEGAEPAVTSTTPPEKKKKKRSS